MLRLPVLPAHYYLDHFVEMLTFVQKTYGSVLAAEHHAFVARFNSLTKDAQCLLIRMVNRRGAIFNRALFKYPEITDVERAVSELMAAGHARALGEADYTAFVSCLPRDVLFTDVIRRNQLTRLRQLGAAGLAAEIGRVDFRFDPEQAYVVVDVETTGSWSSGDRVTEIGAVKVKNHCVVDEWHSLLNPQRPIPLKIIQLTGITNRVLAQRGGSPRPPR